MDNKVDNADDKYDRDDCNHHDAGEWLDFLCHRWSTVGISALNLGDTVWLTNLIVLIISLTEMLALAVQNFS